MYEHLLKRLAMRNEKNAVPVSIGVSNDSDGVQQLIGLFVGTIEELSTIMNDSGDKKAGVFFPILLVSVPFTITFIRASTIKRIDILNKNIFKDYAYKNDRAGYIYYWDTYNTGNNAFSMFFDDGFEDEVDDSSDSKDNNTENNAGNSTEQTDSSYYYNETSTIKTTYYRGEYPYGNAKVMEYLDSELTGEDIDVLQDIPDEEIDAIMKGDKDML